MKRYPSLSTATTTLYAILLLLLFMASIARSAVPKSPFIGISPQDENYYKAPSDAIKCKDGSKKFTKDQLNDNFCDCPDGSDEPGTSACPNGKFYCRNAGHAPVLLFSARVNDGICDCCDGSDEYDGQVKCRNTCWEAGKVARDKLKKKIATYKEGIGIRKQENEQARLSIAKNEAELSKLRSEEKILKPLVQQLKERKEQIEKAEEKERLQKENEERERKEAEEKANNEKSGDEIEKQSPTEDKTDSEGNPLETMHDDEIGTLEDSPSNEHVSVDHPDPVDGAENIDASKVEESPINGVKHSAEKEESLPSKSKENPATVPESDKSAEIEVSDDQAMKDDGVLENTEGLSKEELGRLVASRWTGNTDKQHEEVDGSKDKDHEDHEDHEEMPQDMHDEEYDGYASEDDDDTGKYDDVDTEDDADGPYEDNIHDDTSSYKSDIDDELDFSDTTSPSNPSWLEKIQQTVWNILNAVNLFQTPVDKSEAARIRKEYDDSSTKLSKLQSRISSLTQKLGHDFGPEKEFYSFYDHCFESKENKYVYKICPFKQATQEEGHSTTRLGRWDKFEDSYRTMLFSNGDRCWNGPDRSLKVKLRCGLKNEVAEVDEPSRCEYVAFLSTPAVCLEEKLKELEDKLDLLNKEEPQSHDEL